MIDSTIPGLLEDLQHSVTFAPAEDIKDGDITARLIPESDQGEATIIIRDDCVIAGVEWVNEVFKQQDNSVTVSNRYAKLVEGTGVKLLDTRKTIPGLRSAQKYAVTYGNCYNHRIGLYEAFLIKENHIAACGGITEAITTAKQQEPGKPVEVEVENLTEFKEALGSGADIIMLDNFSLEDMREAVEFNKTQDGETKLEASGGITDETLRPIAETGVDYISIGALTKDCKAVDLSMRFRM